MRVIGSSIDEDQSLSLRHDSSRQVRWSVVQDHEVDLSAGRSLESGNEAEPHVEALGAGGIDAAIEQHAEIDVALSMLATFGDAAKDVRGDKPSCIAERRLQTH